MFEESEEKEFDQRMHEWRDYLSGTVMSMRMNYISDIKSALNSGNSNSIEEMIDPAIFYSHQFIDLIEKYEVLLDDKELDTNLYTRDCDEIKDIIEKIKTIILPLIYKFLELKLYKIENEKESKTEHNKKSIEDHIKDIEGTIYKAEIYIAAKKIMKKIVFDIETRNIFEDVGKADPTLLDISVVCIYDYSTNEYSSYLVEELPKLWKILEEADILIGFNSNHFDIPLLNKYYHGDLNNIQSLDLLEEVRKSIGRRVGLGNIAEATLGYGKSGHGLQAVEWWKKGDIESIKKYCIDDVKVTKEVYEYAMQNKKLKYKDGEIIKDAIIDTKDWDAKKDAVLNRSLFF